MKRARHVLYLDYDGVLHPNKAYRQIKNGVKLRQPVLRAEGHTFFESAQYLVDALSGFPSVAIVLSTSWVSQLKNFRQVKSFLPAALQERVIGSTFHSRITDRYGYENSPRGYQILEDVRHRLPESWIALDDDDELWPVEYRDNLVLLKNTNGLLFDKEAQLKLSMALIKLTTKSS